MNIPDRLCAALLLGKYLRHRTTCICGKGCFQSTLYHTFGYIFRNNSQTFFDKHTNLIQFLIYVSITFGSCIVVSNDYLQEAYITLYRVIVRISANPEIAESFWGYLWVSVKNAYCHLFRDYVLHHLIVIHSCEMYEGNLNYTQMVYFKEYADEYYRKKREYQRQYYRNNRERILEKQRKARQKRNSRHFKDP